MSIKVNSSQNKAFEVAPEGAYAAKCYRVIDLGTHTITTQFGTKEQRLIQFYFEIPSALTSEGKPFIILSRRFNLTFGDKSNLTKFLKAWVRSDYKDGFDFSELLGRPAFITVSHVADEKDSTKIYASIASIMPLPAGMSVPELTHNDPIMLSLDEDFDAGTYEMLPQKTKEFIAQSKEYKKMAGNLVGAMKDMAKDMEKSLPPAVSNDEIPF